MKPALADPDPQISIRPVRLQDVPALNDVCWSERSQADVYQMVSRAQQYALQGRGLGVVVIEADGTLIAYGQLTIWPRCGEISDLYVDDTCRSRGIGTAIIQYLVRACREMHVQLVEIGVARSNPRALALYRRLGFEDSHEITLNLGNGGEPVLYLSLDLTVV